jgi:hypothetical protein
LRSNTGKIKIAEGIVAFANRYGGKLIFGIKDDGDFQGKSIFDIDNNKGTIEEICYKRISPVIDYDIEFFQYDEGDILVVDIPRKKNMPHAYIEERKGPDIKERTYYIRTNHGKRLLTDRQLQWLFQHQEEPDFVYPFRIVLSYLTDSLEFVDTFQIEHPNYVSYYWDFLNIPKNDREKLKENSQSKLASFFLEISPYAFLRSLLYFSDSWLININRHKVTPHSITLPKKVDKKIITINDIPLPQKNSII